jgi:hypothetical protein
MGILIGLSTNDGWSLASMAVAGRGTASWSDGDDRDGGGARLDDRVEREVDGDPGEVAG